MLQESVDQAFVHYLEDRSAQTFEQLRDVVAASPEYTPYADGLEEAEDLLEKGEFDAGFKSLMEKMGNWLLNPGIHHMTAFAILKLGDERLARFEYEVGVAVLEGILSTGDGSEERPYRVLHTADEYDVLEHLAKSSTAQRLVQQDAKHFDVQDCADGSVLWFDITIPYDHLQRSLGQQFAPPGDL